MARHGENQKMESELRSNVLLVWLGQDDTSCTLAGHEYVARWDSTRLAIDQGGRGCSLPQRRFAV